jgi:hypothetical protein
MGRRSPFCNSSSGASAGSGWNIPIADGLRINEREGSHDAETDRRRL